MNAMPPGCQSIRLDACLNGNLSVEEEQAFQEHLDQCGNCRRLLEQLAAPADLWVRASRFLRQDELDGNVHDGSPEAESAQQVIAAVLNTLRPSDDPAMLGRLGGYEISGVVGCGGMGVVLKACDRPLDRTVAIKVLAPHLACSGAARQRFAREARAAAAVIHPSVIAIHGVSPDGPLPFLVMPYLTGSSLQKRIDRDGALPIADALRIGIQLASGLAAAHDQGLIHRDIKPANILLESGTERLVITDFGLARAIDDSTITRSGLIAGTPQYMSPEQARGEPLTPASDLFSLGSVLYVTCTGVPPFQAESTVAVLRKVSDCDPRPVRSLNADVPDWMARLIHRLLEKEAELRFSSAYEVAGLLTQCLAHLAQPEASPMPAVLRADTRSQSVRRTAARLALVSLLALTAGVAYRAFFGARTESGAQAEGTSTAVKGSVLPMESPESPDVPDWDDGLDPVLQHVAETLHGLKGPDEP